MVAGVGSEYEKAFGTPANTQVVDAVKVPVIAAGGIADARGILAAFALGAAAGAARHGLLALS